MNADFWNTRYGEPGFAYGDRPNDYLHSIAARLAPRSRVLCLAEGEGRNAAFLASLGHTCVAVDQSIVGLQKAQALAARHGATIEIIEADLGAWTPAPASFDAFISIFAHLPPGPRAHMHAAAVAALKPGGLAIVELYTPRQLAFNTGGPRDAAMLVEPAALRAELASLTIEHLAEVERDVHEGKYHNGRAAVVQALAVAAAQA